MSVCDNAILKDFSHKPIANGIFMDFAALAAEARQRLSVFDVKYDELDAPASTLSGGNLQKLVLGREFAKKPALAVVVNPTIGLDVKATVEVREYLNSMREGGCAILLVSYDLDEIMELADRILVLFRGECKGIIDRKDASLAVIGELMGGHLSQAVRAGE